jgi:hypothetical protein
MGELRTVRTAAASFHVRELKPESGDAPLGQGLAESGDAPLGQPRRDRFKEGVPHPGTSPMREQIARASVRRAAQECRDGLVRTDIDRQSLASLLGSISRLFMLALESDQAKA